MCHLELTGTKPEFTEQALRLLTPSNPIFQEIDVSGQSVDIKTTVPGKVHEVRAKLGEVCTVPFLDGRQLKVTQRTLVLICCRKESNQA